MTTGAVPAAATPAPSKFNVEARDVVRRLAARLFRVTILLIASREPGLGQHGYGNNTTVAAAAEVGGGGNAPASPVGASAPSGASVSAISAGGAVDGTAEAKQSGHQHVGTSASVSSSSMFGPSPPGPSQAPPSDGQRGPSRSGSTGTGTRTNQPLVNVAMAAANDLTAYLKSVTRGDGKGSGKGEKYSILFSSFVLFLFYFICFPFYIFHIIY